MNLSIVKTISFLIMTASFVITVGGVYLYMDGALKKMDAIEDRINTKARQERVRDQCWNERDQRYNANVLKSLGEIEKGINSSTLQVLQAIYTNRGGTP